jgi:VIT1/CCC1 family predicted Fe2+/Mn2+ transporter
MKKLSESEQTMKSLLFMQQDEINSFHTYKKLSLLIKDPGNSQVVSSIANAEMKHYAILKQITHQDLKPQWGTINFFVALCKVLGLTFGIKLMERGEELAQATYQTLISLYSQLEEIWRDEEKHEDELLQMLDEEGLKYAGSVVLGLNDALVELTGALAGLTLAFQNTHIIALAGMITGISASFSMAASEYLSRKADAEGQDPVKSAIYTGIAYIFTVILLIFPYLVAKNYLVCLAWTIVNAILIIAAFNYYISVAKGFNFRKRFTEMTVISLGVALFSFGIGFLIRTVFGINI